MRPDPIFASLILFAALLGGEARASAQPASQFGPNLRIESCESYPEGGVESLRKDLAWALEGGLRCLSKLDRESRDRAERIRKILGPSSKDRIIIRCGKPGTVIGTDRQGKEIVIGGDSVVRAPMLQGEHDFGMGINPEAIAEHRAPERSDIFLHELHHWLGFSHLSGNKDVAYLSQFCCKAELDPALPPPLGSQSAEACELLEIEPTGLDPDFLARQYRLITSRMPLAVSLHAAWVIAKSKGSAPEAPRTLQEKGAQAVYRTALLAAEFTQAQGRLPREGLTAAILGLAAIEAASPKDQAHMLAELEARLLDRLLSAPGPAQALKRMVIRQWGGIAAALFRNDAQEFVQRLRHMREMRKLVCLHFTPIEIQQVRTAAQYAVLRLPTEFRAEELEADLLLWIKACDPEVEADPEAALRALKEMMPEQRAAKLRKRSP